MQNLFNFCKETGKFPIFNDLDPSEMPAEVMRIFIRTANWIEIQKALEIYKGRKVVKPPKWVLLNYFDRFRSWADRQDEKKLDALSDSGYNWAGALGVSPRLDTWILIEERIYGEIISEHLLSYKTERDKKRR